MRTLLIGANGQLGTDLRATLTGTVLGIDFPACDVRDARQVDQIVADARPDVVLNCAAQTNVDGCEDAAEEAFAINALGALHVARAAQAHGARLVFLSTDYVFGGDLDRAAPYTEADCAAPLGIYGASKLAGEQLSLCYHDQPLIVRTCGLYGHAGARGKGGNFVETMLRVAGEGRALRVVDDQRLSPTSSLACARVLTALIGRGATGLVHVAAEDTCTWYEFARAIFELAGVTADLQPIPSSEYPTRARRPHYSALQSTRLSSWGVPPCGTWRAMLAEYIAARPIRRPAQKT